MALPDSYLRELRDNNDIISVAESYVELKRSGSTYSCRCPFHSERTPSCHFYPDTQSFFCFGCGAGGDVVNFIRLIENLDYYDAIRFLAQRAGMAMPEDKTDDGAKVRQRIYEMNRTAGKFFHEQLFSPEGKAGLDYLTQRGLTTHTIRRFGLGYAADDYHKLHHYMRGLGYTDDELAGGALLARYNNKVYDKFRHRVMFPIFDTRGNIIAFGGRALNADAQAKYLNSDETPVFQKRENLFALNYAKNSKADYFILCEGYMDVISMHQAGFTSAVATLGTAITSSQARLIGRMGKKEVILSYDSDEAGQKAASKGINLLSEAGIKARVLKMVGAKDPDEFIQKFGKEAFEHLINSSGSAIDYELDKLANGLDLNTSDGKATYLKRAVKFLAQLHNPLDRAVYITKTAEVAGIQASTLTSSVDAEINFGKRRQKKEEYRSIVTPRTIADKINPESANHPREEKAERGIICYLFSNPDKLQSIRSKLTNGFVTEFNGMLFSMLAKQIEEGRAPDITALGSELTPQQTGRITGILHDFATFANDNDALADYIKVLNDYAEASAPISAASMTDEELLASLQKQLEKKS